MSDAAPSLTPPTITAGVSQQAAKAPCISLRLVLQIIETVVWTPDPSFHLFVEKEKERPLVRSRFGDPEMCAVSLGPRL